MATTEILSASKALSGFVKIWQVDPRTGGSKLLVDKQNMILKGGAKLIARALGGDPSAKIWGMYIGYNNAGEFSNPSIDVDYQQRFGELGEYFGHLREPLTFSPNYISSEGYEENAVLFSTMITTAAKAGGDAEFTPEVSSIYEVALVASANPVDPTLDTVFSRTNFNPVVYDSNYNFTITWGVRILLP